MRIVHHAHYEVEDIQLNREIDWVKTITEFNICDPKLQYRGVGPIWPGRGSWTRPHIEFDEDPVDPNDIGSWKKIPEIDFPGETYYGVIPVRRISGNVWECNIDNAEYKGP